MDYFHVAPSAAGSWLIGSGQAFLNNVNVNISGAASRITIFNGTSSLGDTIAIINGTVNGLCMQYGRLRAENGLFMSLSGGTPDITVSFE